MQPVLFVSHGSPMLALEPGTWGAALRNWAARLRDLTAILVVSAHWETEGPAAITSAERPVTLHDFSGFPPELNTLTYPAPGAPALAQRIQALLQAGGYPAKLDPERPLDHGAWVPLLSLFPAADLPVVQVSLPRTPDDLIRLGACLRPLRTEGVLIVASGGIVHNLHRLAWEGGEPDPWALAFEGWVETHLATPDVLRRAASQAPGYKESVPTPEHWNPLLVAAGAAEGEAPTSVFAGWQLGSLSLRCWAWEGDR